MSADYPKRRGPYEGGGKMKYRGYELGSNNAGLNRAQRRALEKAKKRRTKLER